MKIEINYIKTLLKETTETARRKLEEFSTEWHNDNIESYYEGQLVILSYLEKEIEELEKEYNKKSDFLKQHPNFDKKVVDTPPSTIEIMEKIEELRKILKGK